MTILEHNQLSYRFVTNLYGFVESEWLERELGLEFEYVSESNISADITARAILTDNLLKWEKVLVSAPHSSIIVFLTGNELYKKEIFSELDNFKSVSIAFVQYLPNNRPRIPLKFISHTLFEDPGLLREREFWGSLKRAFKTYMQLRGIKLNTKTYFLPLGYTNRFVDELMRLSPVKKGESLLGNTRWSENHESRKESIFFTGQKGSWLRRKLVEEIRLEEGAEILTYDGWGGGQKANSTNYVQALTNFRYCLCPPGNLSNETPRYYEAICLGSLPVLSRVSIQDWNNFDYWPALQKIAFSGATSHQVYTRLKQLNQAQFIEILEEIMSSERIKVIQLRELIWFHLNHSKEKRN